MFCNCAYQNKIKDQKFWNQIHFHFTRLVLQMVWDNVVHDIGTKTKICCTNLHTITSLNMRTVRYKKWYLLIQFFIMHFWNIYILLSLSLYRLFDVLKQIVSNLRGSFCSYIYVWYFQSVFYLWNDQWFLGTCNIW